MSQPDRNDSTAQHSATYDPPAEHPAAEGSTSPYAGPPQTQAYQPAGYGPGAPPGYPGQAGYPPNPGYPPPYGYPPYGYPMQRGPVRPGGATASAVLMFIQAAAVLVSTLYVLFGASVAGSFSADGSSLETEWTIIGILQLVSVGLLIFGGVQLLGGTERRLALIANGIQLALVVYWMIRISNLADFDTDGEPFFFVIPLIYAVLPAVALALSASKAVADYMAAKKLSSTTTA